MDLPTAILFLNGVGQLFLVDVTGHRIRPIFAGIVTPLRNCVP
jgi:hypothetical protein